MGFLKWCDLSTQMELIILLAYDIDHIHWPAFAGYMYALV